MLFVLPGSVEWINVPNPDAESLWSCEIRRALQCRCRPSQRNQTSKSAHFCTLYQLLYPEMIVLDLWMLSCTLNVNDWTVNHFCHFLKDSSLLISYFQHLKQQQDGLSHLISVIKDDLEDIKLIEHGLSDSGHMRGGILSWICPTSTHILLTHKVTLLKSDTPVTRTIQWMLFVMVLDLVSKQSCVFRSDLRRASEFKLIPLSIIILAPFYRNFPSLCINKTKTV